MRQLKSTLLYGFFVFSMLFSLPKASYAEALKTKPPLMQPKTTKIGGKFRISAIKKVNGLFITEFSALTKTGKYDILVLESDHIHMGIKEGQELRLSAEILKTEGKKTLVNQMVIFLPAPEGDTPIWLMSKNQPGFGELKAEKYLNLHAPQSDYLIL